MKNEIGNKQRRQEEKDFPSCLKGKGYMSITTDFVSNPILKNIDIKDHWQESRSKRITHVKFP